MIDAVPFPDAVHIKGAKVDKQGFRKKLVFIGCLDGLLMRGMMRIGAHGRCVSPDTKCALTQ